MDDDTPRPQRRRRIWLILSSIIIIAIIGYYGWRILFRSPITIGPDTTVVSGPIDSQGYIDYEAALNEILGKGITPDQNANVLLWQAIGPYPEGKSPMPPEYFRTLGIESPPETGNYFVSFTNHLKHALNIDSQQINSIQEQAEYARQRPWSAADFPQMSSWLEANEKPLQIVIEASRRPEYFNPLTSRRDKEPGSNLLGALLPGVQRCRELSIALNARAMKHLKEKHPDHAWQDILAAHRLGRLISRGGTFIEGLVGIAIDVQASHAELAFLQHSNLTAAQYRKLADELANLPKLDDFGLKADRSERLMFLDAAQLVHRGRGAGLKIEDVLSSRINLDRAMRKGNSMYNRIAKAHQIPNRPERAVALDLLTAELTAEMNADSSVESVLVSLMMPAVRKVFDAEDRSEQWKRNVQVAFALAAFHADHHKYPANLNDLVPQYLSQVSIDYFSSKPLNYQLTEKGYLFYSIGANGNDDGGRGPDDDPKGDDLVVRVPLPEIKKPKPPKP